MGKVTRLLGSKIVRQNKNKKPNNQKMKTFSHHITKSIQSRFGGFRQIAAAACVLALLGATGTSALAQSSGKTRPAHSNFEQFATPTAFGNTYVGEGISRHLGKVAIIDGINIFLGFNADGLFHGFGTHTEVAANGDKLYIAHAWTLDVSVPPAEYVINTTWKIVGGTGRFKNATGNGTAVGRPNADGNNVFIADGVSNN